MDNIHISTEEGRNLGIICSYNGSFVSTYEKWCKAFSDANVKIPDTFQKAYFEYIVNLQKEKHRGIYISNVCVAPELRGHGIGYMMLLHYLSNHKEEISLDVLKDNHSAIHLYERLGFNIEKEYTGFSLDNPKPQCYHMVRPSRNV